jgi:hypothetical protein
MPILDIEFPRLWDCAQKGDSKSIRSSLPYILLTYLDRDGVFAKLVKIAIINNHMPVLQVLLSSHKKYVRDTRVHAGCRRELNNITLVEFASIVGYIEPLQFILQSLNSVTHINIGQPVYFAIRYRHIEPLQLLINTKASIDVQTFNDTVSTTPIHQAVCTKQLDIVTLLIQSNVGINAINQYGETPLVIACVNNLPDIVNLLINANANINKKTRFGRTPLDIAFLNNSPRCIELLLDAGATYRHISF